GLRGRVAGILAGPGAIRTDQPGESCYTAALARLRTGIMNRRTFIKTVAGAGGLGLLGACGKPQRIRLALNWKPDPQFGGFYAAPYQKHSLDVQILPGGAGTPSVQMIGAGSAEFGIVS